MGHSAAATSNRVKLPDFDPYLYLNVLKSDLLCQWNEVLAIGRMCYGHTDTPGRDLACRHNPGISL